MHKIIRALEGTGSLHFQLHIPEVIMDNEVNRLASAGVGNDTTIVFKLDSAAFRHHFPGGQNGELDLHMVEGDSYLLTVSLTLHNKLAQVVNLVSTC